MTDDEKLQIRHEIMSSIENILDRILPIDTYKGRFDRIYNNTYTEFFKEREQEYET